MVSPACLLRFKLDSRAGRQRERTGSRVFARGDLPTPARRPSAAAGICWREEEADFRRSERVRQVLGEPLQASIVRVVDIVGQKNQFCASAEPGGEVPGPSSRPRGGSVAAVIWSVSCGILIESEAFQINPETSGLPAGATSRSEGRRVVTFTQRILERAKTPRAPPPFPCPAPRLPVLQAGLTVSQTPTGPQATSGCNSPFIPPSTPSA